MRDSFVRPFTIIRLIGKNAVEVRLTEEFYRKHPVFPVHQIKQYHKANDEAFTNRKQIVTNEKLVEEDNSRVPAKKIIEDRKIRINGKYNRQYLVKFKNQPAYID
ncbi:hypothetical protein O181_020817 [Austropuccinia psidii MF-1]|uniref:Tf2-1-like SH3-like domain-containing protein n=1 Tax=Austropuccinia psidii MF-1 TaxID=1389203 RepID=A0A9Q3CCC5_9BASI|nr:hypothetical protein [Austropuccinia psidii MF-1]